MNNLQLKQENARLKRMLRSALKSLSLYGSHEFSCPACSFRRDAATAKCTCGFDKAKEVKIIARRR